jgi:predicted CXXCH cytochrome family protein
MRKQARKTAFFAAGKVRLAWVSLVSLAGAFYGVAQSVSPATRSGYVESKVCAGCHLTKWESYRRTGMARSFYRPRPGNTIEEYGKPYYHAPSSTYHEMVQHDGRHFQRQYQIDFNGKRTNESEAEVDFVIGSGNHSRTYLHRTSRNTLIELPLAWYAEKGGYWAMNPGYDRPDHQGRRRLIGDDCMFCHNSYPQIPAESERGLDPVFTSMPEGIDCQRCHGPGERHVALASNPKTSRGDVRAAIVNPARLNADRQMEVCLQCHLETTSFPLPNSIVRYERAPLSYRPGEPLQDFMLHFDRAVGRDPDDRFEIAGSAYRMQRSACFQKSNGALRCTTCHDPHDVPRGQAAERYTAVCRQCHGAAFGRLVASGKHTSSNDCVGCHMPKRRTEDAVHVVMTDHYIQRRKPARDLLADIAERPGDQDPYRGEVVLYYPKTLPHPEDELYLAVAQVEQSSNLSGGVARLEAAIEKYHPERADYYMQLANAWRANGQLERAIPVYQEALRRNPKSIGALQSLALCWMSTREQARAVEILSRALEAAPRNAITWQLLGTANVEQGKLREAVAAFQRATELDAEMPEAYNSLGGIWLRTGDLTRSEPALRKAIELDPNYTQAHNNLANLLAGSGRFEEARYHFEAALRAQPGNSEARYDYAVALARAGRRDDAQQELEATVAANPKAAEAHEFLGTLLAAKGQLARAVEQYRAALSIRPEFGRANLHLGESLVDSGDTRAAVPYLRKAAGSSDAAIRAEALGVLKKLEQRR